MNTDNENILLHPELIYFDVEAEDNEDLIAKLASSLEKEGYVKETYRGAVIEREKNYPTGLRTNGVHVAIPHTDSNHVNKTAIVVANLKKAIKFKEMGLNTGEVDAELVFLLAVKNPKNQVDTLSKLMAVFSDGEKLLKIKNSEEKREIIDILGKELA
ncbi:MAG: PTS sugar transporter subunit IIA [Maledivibacter sp.]|nr:PTS sugar transporter subunit IIA [Maledivibacter sp.]